MRKKIIDRGGTPRGERDVMQIDASSLFGAFIDPDTEQFVLVTREGERAMRVRFECHHSHIPKLAALLQLMAITHQLEDG